MPENAYVLISVEADRTAEVGEKLRAIRVALVREVLGPYDFVVELETDTREDITAVLRSQIRPISGITNTVTCLCF